jgi:integrase
VPPGLEHLWDGQKEFLLGRSLAEAYRAWADRVEPIPSEVQTIGDLLKRYELEVIESDKPATRRSKRDCLPMLRAVFADMTLAALRPTHVYQYADKRRNRKTGEKVTHAAQREIEVLRHAFTKAVEWGVIDRHPFKAEVRLTKPPARTRYVTDQELSAAIQYAPPIVQAYLAIKLLTGLRRKDLLTLRRADITSDGICITTSKTGRGVVFEWSDELRAAVELAKRSSAKVYGLTLFATRRGEPYVKADGSANAWDSLWQRFMAKVVAAGFERFTEHDIRAKVGSDAESLERAKEILTHAPGSTITDRVYRRKPDRVRPLR